MHTLTRLSSIACLALLLAACQRDAAPRTDPAATDAADAASAPQTALGRTVAKAMDEARARLATENISLNDGVHLRINNRRVGPRDQSLPRAEITPDGALLIEGQPVAMDPAAQALALDYRRELIAIAEAGMDIGVQGADLGLRAARDALGSVLRGDTAGMERRIEAEAEGIKASAMRLCERLPALLASQQALAAAVPEFAPYARMTASDIDDCRRETGTHGVRADAGHDAASR